MIAWRSVTTLYQRAFTYLPTFFRRRIYPVDFAIEDFVKEAAAAGTDRRVLDAGAGEGRFRKYFDGDLYCGMDRAVGDRDWDYSHLELIADLAFFPIVARQMDVIICTQVLEHVPDPDAALHEMYRVLRKGGRLYLTAPQGWNEHQQPHDFYRFTSFALSDLLRRSGFREIEIEPLGGYFHYLGHRLAHMPKVLFWGRPLWVRLLLAPVEVVCAAVFSFLAPLLCYYLDRLDDKQEFTLGYRCRARK